MTAPLTVYDLRRELLKRIRKEQRNAFGPAAIVLSEADTYLTHGKPATLDHIESRYLTLHKTLPEANALRVLCVEFVGDVAEAVGAGRSVHAVWADRKANRPVIANAYRKGATP